MIQGPCRTCEDRLFLLSRWQSCDFHFKELPQAAVWGPAPGSWGESWGAVATIQGIDDGGSVWGRNQGVLSSDQAPIYCAERAQGCLTIGCGVGEKSQDAVSMGKELPSAETGPL